MGTHTIHDDPKVNARIEQDLQYIITKIRDTYWDAYAVILAGGFGRGEGTVTFSSDIPRPMNDYDVLVVTKHQHKEERERLEKLSKSLAKTLGIDFVDIGMISVDDLSTAQPSIFNFELKHGSRVIYGPESVVDLVSNFQAKEIPSREGMILLMNRMGDILGRHNPFQSVKELTDKELEFISIPLHKALLACGDSLLLMHGLYDVSYRQRLVALEELEHEGKLSFLTTADMERIRFAYNEKLVPQQFVFEDPSKILTELMPMYQTVFLQFAGHALNTHCVTVRRAVRCFMRSERGPGIHAWAGLRFLIHSHPRQWRLFLDVVGVSRNSIIYAALPALLFSGPWGNTEPSLWSLALDLIEFLQGRQVDGQTKLARWNSARKVGFKLWKALFH